MKFRRTLFWKVAPALVVLQLASVAITAGFIIVYARSAQETLASTALAARMDATAEEIERRTNGLAFGTGSMDEGLRLDLSYRFPDPLILVGLDGTAATPIWPASDGFFTEDLFADSTWYEPTYIQLEEAYDDVYIDLSDDDVPGGFASAPLYDAGGFPVGLLVVQPLTRSLDLELSESRTAFRQSVRNGAILAILVALVFGALLTWWIVRPVRRMATVIADMGGDWQASRVDVSGEDEVALLGSAINDMADRVAESIHSLRTTDRVRRELVANVGHDLRTPLAGIRLHVEEAIRFKEEGRAEEARSALDTAQRQIDFISRLIEDLFELSRLEGDRTLLRLEPVLPAELVSELVGMYQSSAASAGVALETKLESDLPVVEADGNRLIRLMGNLLSNAIRHSADGDKVVVGVGTDGHTLRVTVTDSGPGMDTEEQERLFDRYYRGDDARTRVASHKRTGLGLAIAKAVAEAHGGRLEVESAKGEGTTMILLLPLSKADSTR
ncbi:MAG: ATP-binding protein [Rhodothermales bacterium]